MPKLVQTGEYFSVTTALEKHCTFSKAELCMLFFFFLQFFQLCGVPSFYLQSVSHPLLFISILSLCWNHLFLYLRSFEFCPCWKEELLFFFFPIKCRSEKHWCFYSWHHSGLYELVILESLFLLKAKIQVLYIVEGCINRPPGGSSFRAYVIDTLAGKRVFSSCLSFPLFLTVRMTSMIGLG